MAAAMYLEHYLDSLESLPKELQKNFSLMRDLDSQSQEVLKEIDKLADDYLVGCRGMKGDARKEHLGGIQKLFGQSKKFGDEKVQLALQTYELVDRHIRHLDSELARFEAELKDKPVSAMMIKTPKDKTAGKDKTGKDKPGSKDKESKKKRKERAGGGKDTSGGEPLKKKKKKSEDTNLASPPLVRLSFGSSHPSDVLDMPVDPNEPTYCTCHQVSYGEMIGCDNQDCPIEWFHFACVSLSTKPKGKWFCPRCIVERKKKP